MKFSDIERGDLKAIIDGPVDELMSLGSEIRKATGQLASKLDDLSKQTDPDVSYANIDRMMRSICKDHGCKGSELHDDFIAAKGMTPDEYVRDRMRGNGKNVLETPRKLREHMLPGDVLMIESDREAVVGTVLSIDGGMIILEGGVYPLDEGEVIPFPKKEIQKQEEPAVGKPLESDSMPHHEEMREITRHIWHLMHAPGNEDNGAEIEKWDDEATKFGYVSATDPDDYPYWDLSWRYEPTGALYIMRRAELERPLGTDITEAEYQGREVKLGKPMRDASGSKKFKVYVRDPKTGNIKKVMFGDKNMEIKRDDPARRKSFRARHGCGTARASDRTKAAYWSCRLWSTTPVSKITK